MGCTHIWCWRSFCNDGCFICCTRRGFFPLFSWPYEHLFVVNLDIIAYIWNNVFGVWQSTGAFFAVSRYASATPLPPSILSRGVGWQVLKVTSYKRKCAKQSYIWKFCLFLFCFPMILGSGHLVFWYIWHRKWIVSSHVRSLQQLRLRDLIH